MNEYANETHYQWLENELKIKCSALGKTIANIIGYIANGIYNAPIKHKEINWGHNYFIEIGWKGSLSNWDFRNLTQLVIECHRRKIRVEINPKSNTTIGFLFHQRETHDREQGMSRCLPNIEYMVKIQDQEWGR